jgi:hypothetical protein
MPKWKIWYDVGFGREDGSMVEAESEDEALEAAYEEFTQACDSQHSYGVEEEETDEAAGEGKTDKEPSP